jgi:phosphatidate cytidylyltransferase
MLGKRLATGLILALVLTVAVMVDERLAPWYPCWFLLAAVAMVEGAREICGLLARTSARPSANAVFGGVLALVVANWAPHVTAALEAAPALDGLSAMGPPAVFAWPLWAFAAAVMATFVAQSVQFVEPGRTMATIAGTVLAIAYVGLLGSFVIQFRWLGGPHLGLLAVAGLFATAKGADIGAYTFGRLAGRHKLWPRLSPNKTVEGAMGGLVFGVIGAVGVEAMAQGVFGHELLGWRAAVGFGLAVGAAAQLGDLMESMIKRDCAQKDASDTLPGFGGVLDVLDSLLFAGPVAYGYWLLVGL